MGGEGEARLENDGNTRPDDKVHVVWAVDVPSISNLIELEWDAEDGADTRPVPNTSSNSHGTSRASTYFVASEGSIPHLRPLEPAYKNGDRVEYFSSSHATWLPSHVVRASSRREESIIYDVKVIGTGQLRCDVPLSCLRFPLAPHERIEYYAVAHGGRWLAGVVQGVQGAHVSTFGYCVEIENPNGVFRPLEQVPAERLRRRFLVGDVVKVYRGESLGWVRCSVVQASSSDVQGPLVSPRAETFFHGQGVLPSHTGASAAAWLWTKVYVDLDGVDYVPSFLVRSCLEEDLSV